MRGPDAWHLFVRNQNPGRHIPPGTKHATSDDLVVCDPAVDSLPLLAGGPLMLTAHHARRSAVGERRSEHDGRWHMVYACQPEPDSSSALRAGRIPTSLWNPGEAFPATARLSSSRCPSGTRSGREKGVLECKDPWVIPYEGRFLDVLRMPEHGGATRGIALAESDRPGPLGGPWAADDLPANRELPPGTVGLRGSSRVIMRRRQVLHLP